MGNNPISGIDPDGGYVYILGKNGSITRAIGSVLETEIGSKSYLKFANSDSEHLIIADVDLKEGGFGFTVSPLSVGSPTKLTKDNLSSLLNSGRSVKGIPEGAALDEFDIAGNFVGATLQPGDNYLIAIDVNESLKRGHGTLAEAIFHEPTIHANRNKESALSEHVRHTGNRFGHYNNGNRRVIGSTLDLFLKQFKKPKFNPDALGFFPDSNQLFFIPKNLLKGVYTPEPGFFGIANEFK
jgi:hypothetical protein